MEAHGNEIAYDDDDHLFNNSNTLHSSIFLYNPN
jgi:hypothetical protein